MGNNKGKWDSFYANLTDREHYIDSDSYRVGAQFLADCEIVEDWGCGKGWFALVAKEFDLDVVGADGSQTLFANIPEISIPVSVWENILLKNNVTWVREFVDSPLAWGEETYYFLSK